MRRHLRPLLLTLAALAAPPSTALADRPELYKGRFDFAVTQSVPMSPTRVFVRGSLAGIETVLGTFTGEVQYNYNPKTGKFTGSLFKRASGGDLLYEDVDGQFTATGSTGSFVITGGTGRFKGAGGGGNFLGLWTSPTLSTAFITFDGSLTHAGLGNAQMAGRVAFSNVQAALKAGGPAPYFGAGDGGLIGKHTQTGSILNTSGLIPIDATTLVFLGEVGPNPFLPGNPKVHVIETKNGQIFCTWTAVFTLKIVDAAGTGLFSGDGDFTVTGGTGKYQGATGRFTTLFETQPVPRGAENAIADFQQFGTVRRR